MTIRQFNRRLIALAKLEQWRRGEDDSMESRMQRIMDRVEKQQSKHA